MQCQYKYYALDPLLNPIHHIRTVAHSTYLYTGNGNIIKQLSRRKYSTVNYRRRVKTGRGQETTVAFENKLKFGRKTPEWTFFISIFFFFLPFSGTFSTVFFTPNAPVNYWSVHFLSHCRYSSCSPISFSNFFFIQHPYVSAGQCD